MKPKWRGNRGRGSATKTWKETELQETEWHKGKKRRKTERKETEWHKDKIRGKTECIKKEQNTIWNKKSKVI